MTIKLVSISGGKDSTATLLLALERHPKEEVMAVFADTGNEHPTTLEDEYHYPLHLQGSVSTLPVPAEDDVIARLHQAVKDVTGKDVEAAPKPRIGFLP